ncbi:MAG: hypothetical protein A2X29_05170 [Elusimicrobia bacterium GWA2_64_40]|nr:MAG: hypothetical protein A2X29_05170 [Elusimicrobia bacterium GWA2_64_40]HAN04575.1 hypothetical protein [Elusimicrobiota bacterium]
MGKALKILLWTAAGAVLALGAAAAAAKFYFTQERLKALTTDYARKNLRREIAFEAVALNLSGISIAKLRVSEYPDFKKGEFFSADSFSMRPSFRALLRREVRIESVSASGLSVRVTEVKPETYNFSDLLAAEPAPKPQRQAQPEAAAPRLTVSSLKVRGSRFVYTNAAGDLSVTLRDIDLSASAISPDGLFPAEGKFTLAVASPYFNGEVPARVKGRLALGGFAPERGSAEIEKASFTLGKVEADLKGTLKNLLEPDARLQLTVRQFSTADLRQVYGNLPPKILLPEIEAEADFKLTQKDIKIRSARLRAGPLKAALKGRAAWAPRLSYDLQADASAQIPEIDTTLLARKAKMYPVPRGLKLPLTEVSASLRLRDGKAEIRSFAADAAPFSVKGKAVVAFSGARLRASGSARAEMHNLARLAEIAPAALAAYGLSGAASAAFDYTYAGALSLSGKASLKDAGAAYAGYSLSGLRGDVDFTGDSAASKKIQGRLDGGDFTASFSLRDALAHPKAEFDLDISKLTLKDAPPAAAPAAKVSPAAPAGKPFYADISGSARAGAIEHPNLRCGPAAFRLNLRNVSADLQALDGSASFSAGPGKFSELYKLAARYKAAKVALYPLLVLQKASKAAKGLNLPDFDNIDFELAEGDYAFAKGQMRLNKSGLIASVADVSSTGSINLPAERLDMRLSVAMKRASGISMSVPVGLFVKGTFADPAVKPDVKSIAEQPAVKKAVERLAPKAEKLLKGLFNK